jgi:hypothetical protein
MHPARAGAMIWDAVRLWLLLTLATLLVGVLLRPAPTLATEGLNHAGLFVQVGDLPYTAGACWQPAASTSSASAPEPSVTGAAMGSMRAMTPSPPSAPKAGSET